MGINALSLFDGICAGRSALERAGIEVDNFYSSEVDKFAIKVNETRYPDNIHLGDVTKWREWYIDWSSIDMVIGGSPCQGFSVAGNQGGTKAVLNGEEILVADRKTYLHMKSMNAEFKSQSHLFWEYVLIVDYVKKHNPNVKFLLENVRMKKELLNMISDALGVKDMVINSSLLSAQNRVRHYWFNWEVDQPEDKGIFLKDILEDIEIYGLEATHKESQLLSAVDGEVRVKQAAKKGYIVAGDGGGVNLSLPTSKTRRGRVIKQKSQTLETSCNVGVILGVGKRIKEGNSGNIATVTDIKGMDCIKRIYGTEGKSPTLTTMAGGHREPKVIEFELDEKNKAIGDNIYYRKLTPTECARLQTFPDGWSEDIVSKSQAYKQYGNSWTVDVIAHIFSGVKDELSKNE